MGQLNTYNPIWKAIDRTGNILDTHPKDNIYKHLYVFRACEQSCIMMTMGGSKMS